MATIREKIPILIAFVIPLFNEHAVANSSAASPPFFLGLSGPQGSGKTTLATALAKTLRGTPHNLNVAVLSIDDLYLTYACQSKLRELYPENRLVSCRGEPGTHDIGLGRKVFASLAQQRETKVPAYDKSAHQGKGDRVDEAYWETVKGPVDIIIFEGWCVGFRALPEDIVEQRWRESRGKYLQRHKLEDVLFVNAKLREYDELTNFLDALLHVDCEDITFVYEWRLQQEHRLIASKGSGMSDEEVMVFIDGYMPAYELYMNGLRNGAFRDKGKQLRIVFGSERQIMKAASM